MAAARRPTSWRQSCLIGRMAEFGGSPVHSWPEERREPNEAGTSCGGCAAIDPGHLAVCLVFCDSAALLRIRKPHCFLVRHRRAELPCNTSAAHRKVSSLPLGGDSRGSSSGSSFAMKINDARGGSTPISCGGNNLPAVTAHGPCV